MQLDQPVRYIGITPIQAIEAILILIVGVFLTKLIVGLFRKTLKKTKLSEIVVEFLAKFLASLLYVMIILLSISALGVAVGSAVLGLSAVIGLVLGFGMQDTLTNLTAGVWLAAFRPIDIGEVVTVAGQTGKVEDIGVMAIKLLQPDNTVVTIPNKLVWGSVIVNHTRMKTKRVSVDIGIAYGSDLDKAIKLAVELMENHPKILKNPAPSVVITALADSSINLQLRAWVKTEEYWEVRGDLIKGIYEIYMKEGIEIPFPQMDVHIKEMP